MTDYKLVPPKNADDAPTVLGVEWTNEFGVDFNTPSGIPEAKVMEEKELKLWLVGLNEVLDSRESWIKGLLGALYDWHQCNTFFQTGDLIEVEGGQLWPITGKKRRQRFEGFSFRVYSCHIHVEE